MNPTIVLRIHTEVDNDYDGAVRIMHWTGTKGKNIIKELIWSIYQHDMIVRFRFVFLHST